MKDKEKYKHTGEFYQVMKEFKGGKESVKEVEKEKGIKC